MTVHPETSTAFGFGWRLGFLGVLHMEVFSQRLESEYGTSVVVTTPTVPYRIVLSEKHRKGRDEVVTVTNPNDWVERPLAERYLEPMVRGTVLSPSEHLSEVLSLCNGRRGTQLSCEFIDQVMRQLK